MNLICMLNLLKKNCSAVACQCTCVPSTKKNVRVVCAPSLMWQWPVGALFRWLFRHPILAQCCPLQLFRVVAHWVAMRSWSLVRLNTSLERSVQPPLASMCSPDKEKVFPTIDNAEITNFNFKRNNTLTCSAICRSLVLGLLPSGHDCLLVPTLISFSSGCQQFRLSLRKGDSLSWFRARLVPAGWTGVSWERWAARFLAATAPPFLWNAGQPYAYAVGVSPDWCSPASSLLPLVKVNCSRNLKK